VRDIALDAGDWSTAYVIDNDDVFVTTDAGVSWREITGNLTTSTCAPSSLFRATPRCPRGRPLGCISNERRRP
jgi:hypothetical protein